jgi:hypothetical protein
VSSEREDRSAREDRLRAGLTPLGEHERPAPLLAAVAVAVVVAIGVIVGVLASKHLSREGGSIPGGIFIAVALLVLALNMYRRRYWAVLGFEALLAFQVIATSLALIVARTLLAAGICVVAVALGGWLFWKLIRVMGRIQAVEHDEDGAV